MSKQISHQAIFVIISKFLEPISILALAMILICFSAMTCCLLAIKSIRNKTHLHLQPSALESHDWIFFEEALRTPLTKEDIRNNLPEMLATNIPGFKQAQIIQEETDHLHFKIVRGGDFSEKSIEIFRRQLLTYFGEKMKHSWEFVEEIPKESSGK